LQPAITSVLRIKLVFEDNNRYLNNATGLPALFLTCNRFYAIVTLPNFNPFYASFSLGGVVKTSPIVDENIRAILIRETKQFVRDNLWNL